MGSCALAFLVFNQIATLTMPMCALPPERKALSHRNDFSTEYIFQRTIKRKAERVAPRLHHDLQSISCSLPIEGRQKLTLAIPLRHPALGKQLPLLAGTTECNVSSTSFIFSMGIIYLPGVRSDSNRRIPEPQSGGLTAGLRTQLLS